ncbi:type VII secretion system-associated protein [Streptomyces sp. NPDC088729]|uniref:type VII secretion system-associated protein n=1 Tax=Streptomyces sp. NPDC088729 TaxID=3365876 RepID=UPI0038249523
MAEKADVKHFDLKQMENFRDLEVEPVLRSAKVTREEIENGVRPLGKMVDKYTYTSAENPEKGDQVLRIGKIGRDPDDWVSGKVLLDAVKASVTEIDKLLGEQVALFKELKEALTETIDEANKTKDKNLDAIDAQTLLQTFDEVDAFTVGGTDGSGGKTS